ncbi:MAG TPA: T9SS type A sorting domain-containing protein [Bacteroidia bacterium]|nr:T9SS type A sorting domain-containing protein [Bacteroidia bacterium]
MKRKFLLLILCFSVAFVFAQTSPTSFDLSTGTYTFLQWDSSSTINPAGTYPSNMKFHTLGTQNPDENTPANGDWACAYDLNTGCFIKGLAQQGFGFRNIGNSQTASCMSNGTGTNIYVGDATIALNTTSCENISVSWIGRMISNFTYSDSTPVSRFYSIACQYRIGSSGTFTNVPGNYLFTCNSDSVTYKLVGTADTLVSILPDTCNNQPMVEIRWIYHQTAQNSGGPRPVLAVDDINITRDIVTETYKPTIVKKALSIYPNPNLGGKVNLNKTCSFVVVDMLGHTVGKVTNGKEYNTDNLTKGAYFIKTNEGEIVKFLRQ